MTDKLIKILLVVALILGSGYLAFEKVKGLGYAEAEAKYQKVIKEYDDEVRKKINDIADTSNILVAENRESSANLARGIGSIVSNTRGKTLTIIKDGECTPAPIFLDSFSEMAKRANKSMKDSQK